MTAAIVNRLDSYVAWPTDAELIGFEQQNSRMASVRGCTLTMDGTHIKINRPIEHGYQYHNRKKFFSIIMHVLVDPNGMIRHMQVGSPGRGSDSTVFRNSPVSEVIQETMPRLGEIRCAANQHEIIKIPYYVLGELFDSCPIMVARMCGVECQLTHLHYIIR